MGGLGTGFNIIELALQEQRTVSKLSDDFIKTFSMTYTHVLCFWKKFN